MTTDLIIMRVNVRTTTTTTTTTTTVTTLSAFSFSECFSQPRSPHCLPSPLRLRRNWTKTNSNIDYFYMLSFVCGVLDSSNPPPPVLGSKRNESWLAESTILFFASTTIHSYFLSWREKAHSPVLASRGLPLPRSKKKSFASLDTSSPGGGVVWRESKPRSFRPRWCYRFLRRYDSTLMGNKMEGGGDVRFND